MSHISRVLGDGINFSLWEGKAPDTGPVFTIFQIILLTFIVTFGRICVDFLQIFLFRAHSHCLLPVDVIR